MYNSDGYKIQLYQDEVGQVWKATSDGVDCLWSKQDNETPKENQK
jgi:hypothetical protein